jgi:hypothetical protein
MSAPSINGIFAIGVDILKTVRDTVTNTILAQIGSVTEEYSASDNAEWWQHVGLSSRPSVPVAKTSAAQAIAIRCSDRDRVIASRDVRGQQIYGQLGDGETCLYAGGTDGKAQGRVFVKANGNVCMYTAQGNAVGGQSVTLQTNADGSIVAANQYGAITLSSAGLKIAIGTTAGITIDMQGNVAIIGLAIALNGSSVSLGANAVMPVCWGPVGISGVGSTSVKVAI